MCLLAFQLTVNPSAFANPQVEFNKAALSLADAFPADQKKAALNRLLKVGGPACLALQAASWCTRWQAVVHAVSVGAAGSIPQPHSTQSDMPKLLCWKRCTRSLLLHQPLHLFVLACLLQDNVALIAVLEALEPPFADGGGPSGSSRRQLVCVANTHIHSNPELNDVKLWQVCLRAVSLIASCLGGCTGCPAFELHRQACAAPLSAPPWLLSERVTQVFPLGWSTGCALPRGPHGSSMCCAVLNLIRAC